MCNCTSENLEIPGLVLAHHPGMTEGAPSGLTAICRRAIEQRAFYFRTFAGKPPCLFD
jgi:hypothetical protein